MTGKKKRVFDTETKGFLIQIAQITEISEMGNFSKIIRAISNQRTSKFPDPTKLTWSIMTQYSLNKC